MRFYPVPIQYHHEEKVIGGYLTLRQFVYLVLGAGLGGALGAVLPGPAFLRVAAGLGPLLFGVAAAFMRYRFGLRLDEYLFYRARFRLLVKQYSLYPREVIAVAPVPERKRLLEAGAERR